MAHDQQPLAGRRVVVTRRLEDAAPLTQALQALGAEVLAVPSLTTRFLPASHWQPALAQLEDITCVVFASRLGVEAFARALGKGLWKLPAAAAVWAVGPSTQKWAHRQFQRPIRVPSTHTAEGLAQHLVTSLSPDKDHVLLVGAKQGRTIVREMLQARRIAVTPLALYATTPCAGARVGLAKGYDYVLFTSPSCVTGWLMGGPHPSGSRCISIGPTTSQALRQAGLVVFAQAQTPSVAGLVAAILENER